MASAYFFPASLTATGKRYLAVQAFSTACSWGTRFAVAWWVYRVSSSSWLLGLAAFLGQGFSLFVIPFAGSLADSFGRKRLYLCTQAASMFQVSALLLLVLRRCEDLRVLFVLCAIRGIIFAFEQPARDGFWADLANSQDVREVIAFQASLVQVGRLVGPAIAGLLIHLTGEWSCFALDCASYVPVIIALALLPEGASSRRIAELPAGWWQELTCGWKIVGSSGCCLRAVLLLVCLNLLGLPLLTVLPSFVREALHGGPVLLSLLVCASGIGAIAANYSLIRICRTRDLECFILPAFLATGFALMLISIAHRPSVALLAVFISGYAAMTQISGTNILLQSNCGAEARGRVMAVYVVAFWGVAPFGSLLIGEATAHAGIRSCLFLYGLICLVIGQLVFLFVHAYAPLLGKSKWPVTTLEESRYAGL